MGESGDLVVDHRALRAFITEVFEHAGCSTAEAGRIADNLVDANLTGHDSHGVIRVRRYVDWLIHGVQYADKELSTIVDEGPLLLVDGHYGMGQTIGPLAVKLGIERCREHGLAIVALRRAGHLGRIGEYAETTAAAGLVSIHIVNVAASRLVAPFGSRSRRMGTNPMAFGVPRTDGPPVIHDFATSVVAEGKAMVALHGGPPVPDDALVGEDGNVTGDPSVLYEIVPGRTPNTAGGTGALRAMGEHKGSGLSVMCELLAGALTGGGTASPSTERFSNGMLSVYVDPARIDPDDGFTASVTDYIDWFLDADTTTDNDKVRLPGDKERERRADREANGLTIPSDAWASIVGGAERAGMTPEQIAGHSP